MASGNHVSSCPSDDELFRGSSAVLQADAQTRLDAHVDQCERCQARRREWTETLDAYRAALRTETSDGPPLSTFRRALYAVDESRTAESAKIRQRLSSGLAVAAALILAIVWYSQTEVKLSAETVLARSLEFERSQRPAASSVGIRRLPHHSSFASPTIVQTNATGRGTADTFERLSRETPLGAEIARRLAAYGFDWNRPVSATTFSRWRLAAPARHDRVDVLDNGLLRITTTARGDNVEHAELTMRAASFEPVSESWAFADGVAIELSTIGTIAPSIPAAPAIPSSPAAATIAAPPRIDLEAVELDARIAVQRLGWTGADPLAIRRIGRTIRIEGQVSSAGLAARLKSAAPPGGAWEIRTTVARTAPPVTSAEASPALAAWLTNTFASPARESDFRIASVDLSDRLLRATKDLRSLAERYPLSSETHLSPEAESKLGELASVEYFDAVAAYESLEHHVAPLVGTIDRPTIPREQPGDWRLRAAKAHGIAEQLGETIRNLVGPADFAGEADFETGARSRLRPALHALAQTLLGTSP